jgi:hypothetical protein
VEPNKKDSQILKRIQNKFPTTSRDSRTHHSRYRPLSRALRNSISDQWKENSQNFFPGRIPPFESHGNMILCLNQSSLNGKFPFYLLLIQLIQQNHRIYFISSIDQRYHLEYLLRKYVSEVFSYILILFPTIF